MRRCCALFCFLSCPSSIAHPSAYSPPKRRLPRTHVACTLATASLPTPTPSLSATSTAPDAVLVDVSRLTALCSNTPGCRSSSTGLGPSPPSRAFSAPSARPSLRLLRSVVCPTPSTLLASAMSASTLHPGAPAVSVTHPGIVVRHLGEDGHGSSEGSGAATAAPAPPSRRRHRSFADAVEVVNKMTGRRPNKCPDGFEITKRYLDRLGFTPILERIRFVHVAGTKGKGTTSAYTAALLQAYGFKVGLFTSPHLTDLRERTVVDGRLLDENKYAEYFFDFLDRYEALQYSASQLDRDIAAPSRANFFRFVFLLSLYIFEQEGVEVAVMEVGMGGRIDSTNTVPSEVSIITALGYDHMEILGDAIQDIAGEKAGIMKPGVVCFAAPQVDHPETRAVLEKHAHEVGAPLVLLDDNVVPIRSWPRLAIGGVHAVEDSKLALMAARRIANIPPILPLDEVERSVLQSMTYAGRSQIVEVDGGTDATFYLDGAHTTESLHGATEWFLEASAARTKDAAPRRVLLFYTSRDPTRILKAFMPYISKFCKVVVAQVTNPRMTSQSTDPSDVAGKLSELRAEMVATTERWRAMYREVPCLPCARPFSALEDILDLVVPAASDGEDASKPAQVFVCGSFFLVGDVVKLLKVYEAGDRRSE